MRPSPRTCSVGESARPTHMASHGPGPGHVQICSFGDLQPTNPPTCTNLFTIGKRAAGLRFKGLLVQNNFVAMLTGIRKGQRSTRSLNILIDIAFQNGFLWYVGKYCFIAEISFYTSLFELPW